MPFSAPANRPERTSSRLELVALEVVVSRPISAWIEPGIRDPSGAFDCETFLRGGVPLQKGCEGSRLLGPVPRLCMPCSLGAAWRCGVSGIHLSTQGPHGFRESAWPPRLGADAENDFRRRSGRAKSASNFRQAGLYYEYANLGVTTGKPPKILGIRKAERSRRLKGSKWSLRARQSPR